MSQALPTSIMNIQEQLMQLLAQQAIAITALQQQIIAMMIDGQTWKADVAKLPMFSGKREEVIPFINAC